MSGMRPGCRGLIYQLATVDGKPLIPPLRKQVMVSTGTFYGQIHVM